LRRARWRGTGVKGMWLAGSAASASNAAQSNGVVLIDQLMRALVGCRKVFRGVAGRPENGSFRPIADISQMADVDPWLKQTCVSRCGSGEAY
jgi:hypothetical protein